MARLSVADLVLECDGSVVSCSRDGAVLGTLVVPEDKSALDFGTVQLCLNSVEWDELLGTKLAEEAVKTATSTSRKR